MSDPSATGFVGARRARQIAYRYENLPPHLRQEVSKRLGLTAGEAGELANILTGDRAIFRADLLKDMETIMDNGGMPK